MATFFVQCRTEAKLTAAGALIRYVPNATFHATPSTRQSSSTVAANVDVADCGLVPAAASVPAEANRTRCARTAAAPEPRAISGRLLSGWAGVLLRRMTVG